MRTYHAKSYSEQARTMADKYFNRIKNGMITEKEAINFISTSYRDPIIRERAAKRLRKKLKKLLTK